MWLTLPFYDFCGFRSVAVNSVYKLQFFLHFLLIAPQPWELAKKLQLAQIGSRPRTFQRAIVEPCTSPLTPPKGGTKRDFAILSSKFQILSKKVCYKVSLCDNVQGQCYVIATPFLYLTVQGWNTGNVPMYQKFALKVTHPFRKR